MVKYLSYNFVRTIQRLVMKYMPLVRQNALIIKLKFNIYFMDIIIIIIIVIYW